MESQARLAEGLVCVQDNSGNNVLYWIDILKKSVYSYNIRQNKYTQWVLDTDTICSEYISAILPTCKNKFIIPFEKELVIWNRDENKPECRTKQLITNGLRFNDAKIGPDGNIWVGTMDLFDRPNKGALHRATIITSLDSNNKIIDVKWETIIPNVSLSNGFGWNLDKELFYFIDTPTKKIQVFEYNIDDHTLGKRRRDIDLHLYEGVPDGMYITKSGTIYVAMWDGSSILEITDKYGIYNDEDIVIYKVPVKRPTTCVVLDNICYYVSAYVEGEQNSGKLNYIYLKNDKI